MNNASTRAAVLRADRFHGRHQMLIDALEPRVLLSTITWVNRGQTSDQFASVFGSNANLARSVIDAVITSWEREIVNFNYPGGGNTYNITISMATSGTSLGANTSVTARSSDGKPDAGSITIGRGTNGSGGGYFLDPTPLDSSEFTNYTNNAYAAYAGAASPVNGIFDLYEVVLHEMGHAMGFDGDGNEAAYVTDTAVTDTADSALGRVSPAVGNYYRFDGAAVNGSSGHFLLTSFDSGGQSGTANDHGSPDHFAAPGATYTYNGITYLGEDDLMTPYYTNNQRRLISQDDLTVLADSFGYTVQTANYYGTEYDTLDASGELRIRVPGSGNNTISLTESGGNLTVSLSLGSAVAGADPTLLTSVFSASAVTSVSILGGGGNDLIGTDALGGAVPVTVTGNGGSDTMVVNNLATNVYTYGSKITGANVDLALVSGLTNLDLNAGSTATAFYVDGMPVANGHATLNGGAGNDTLYYGQGDLTLAPSFYFSGGGGTNGVVIDNTASSGTWSYDLSDNRFQANGPASFNRTDTFSQVGNYNLLSGSSDDSFYTNMGVTTDGVSLSGGGGANTYNLGPNSSYQLIGTYAVIGSAGDQLYVDDNQSSTNLTYTLTSSGVSDSQMSVAEFSVGTLYINTSNGTDTTNVTSLPSAAVTLYEGNGTDTVNVGTSSHTLPAFYSGFTVNGFSNGNTALVLDNSAVSSLTYSTVTSNSFSAGPGTLNYSGLSSLTYDEASYQNVLNVNSSYIATTYTFNCDYDTGVNIGNGDLTNVVTNTLFNVNAMYINAASSINVGDQNDATARAYVLSRGSITVSGHLQIDYNNGCPVSLTGGTGNDSIALISNSVVNPVSINGGAGNDAVTVGSTSTNLGSVLYAGVTVAGGGGTDSLAVNDPAEDPLSVTSTYVGPLLGTTPYSQTFYSGFSGLTVYHGDTGGGGSVAVSSTAAGTPVTLTLSSGNEPVTVTATDPTAAVTLTPNAGVDAVTVGGGTAVVDFAASQVIGTLTLNAGGTAVVTQSIRKVLTISGLSLNGNGVLDLTRNDLIFHGGTLASVTAAVASGYNPAGGGNWKGSGITSSAAANDSTHQTALGTIVNTANNNPIFNAAKPFDGSVPAPGDVLVKFTYFGDANLDGKVDGSDYTQIDNGYNVDKSNHGTGPLTGWYNGDFNYDKLIDSSDYSLIDNAFNTQTTVLAAPNAQVAAAKAASTVESASAGPVSVVKKSPPRSTDTVFGVTKISPPATPHQRAGSGHRRKLTADQLG